MLNPGRRLYRGRGRTKSYEVGRWGGAGGYIWFEKLYIWIDMYPGQAPDTYLRLRILNLGFVHFPSTHQLLKDRENHTSNHAW